MVYVMLGSGVLAEFTYAEALKFHQDNLDKQRTRLSEISEDLEWLMKQRTVAEVNTSRLFNFSNMERKAAREEAAKASA